MTARDLILTIAVNLGRFGRWAQDGKTKRIDQFLEETDISLSALQRLSLPEKFIPTLQRFTSEYTQLKKARVRDDAWAEAMNTWANILIHRSKYLN